MPDRYKQFKLLKIMKTLNLLGILLILFITLSCSSDDNTVIDNTSENSNLLKRIILQQNGDVATEWEFEYDNNLLISITNEFDEKLEYNYLENGFLDYEKTFLYNNADETYDIETEKKDFLYDNEILISDIVYENEQIIYGHNYILNDQGKIEEYIYYSGSDLNSYGGKRIFEYESGNVTEQIQTDSNDDLANKYQYLFDSQKNPFLNLDIQIKRLFWFEGLNSMNYNNINSYTIFDSNDIQIVSYSYMYQYNDDGFPISRQKINNTNNEITEMVTFEYYDDE